MNMNEVDDEMKKITKIMSIDLNDKVPNGFRYIKSWEVERLLCEDFNIFKDLKIYEYYKINNNYRYLWLGRLPDFDSHVGGRGQGLDDGIGRAREVLVCNK